MRLSRLSMLGVGVLSSMALVALMTDTATGAAGEQLTYARTAQASAAARPVLGPPVGRAVPAASAPSVASAGTSPWEPLRHAPPFYPGTMLLASDGTVLVHSEPPSGGTSVWYKLTPNPKGSYVDGTWSQIASMPAAMTLCISPPRSSRTGR